MFKKIKSFFVKIFDIVFPMFANLAVNKKTRKNLSTTKGILNQVENADKIQLDELKKLYDDTLRVKDKLEDKAKTNVVSVSISITLIMGASGFLSAINDKFCNLSFIPWLTFSLFIISVSYMLIAGIFVVKMLISENQKYVIALESLVSGDDDILRNDYSICIAKNRYANTIRNNYVYTSYECIRNALVCLFVVFIFVAIPI